MECGLFVSCWERGCSFDANDNMLRVMENFRMMLIGKVENLYVNWGVQIIKKGSLA